MGTHPIFESDFDCLTDVSYLRALARVFGDFGRGCRDKG